MRSVWSACFDKYQYAVGRDDNLFLFRGDGRVLVLAQGFLDLLLDFEQGGVQRGCLGSDFWKSGTWAVQPSAESVQSTG